MDSLSSVLFILTIVFLTLWLTKKSGTSDSAFCNSINAGTFSINATQSFNDPNYEGASCTSISWNSITNQIVTYVYTGGPINDLYIQNATANAADPLPSQFYTMSQPAWLQNYTNSNDYYSIENVSKSTYIDIYTTSSFTSPVTFSAFVQYANSFSEQLLFCWIPV